MGNSVLKNSKKRATLHPQSRANRICTSCKRLQYQWAAELPEVKPLVSIADATVTRKLNVFPETLIFSSESSEAE